MENLADSTVGCVSSQDQIVNAEGNPDAGAGEGFYVRYEMALRQAEAALHPRHSRAAGGEGQPQEQRPVTLGQRRQREAHRGGAARGQDGLGRRRSPGHHHHVLPVEPGRHGQFQQARQVLNDHVGNYQDQDGICKSQQGQSAGQRNGN